MGRIAGLRLWAHRQASYGIATVLHIRLLLDKADRHRERESVSSSTPSLARASNVDQPACGIKVWEPGIVAHRSARVFGFGLSVQRRLPLASAACGKSMARRCGCFPRR